MTGDAADLDTLVTWVAKFWAGAGGQTWGDTVFRKALNECLCRLTNAFDAAHKAHRSEFRIAGKQADVRVRRFGPDTLVFC